MGRHLRRVLVYALGGGHGHAVRGCTLVRALQARGVEAAALVRADDVPRALDVPHEVCPRPESPSALRRWLLERCRQFEADTLVVDTFAEGLLGELDETWSGPPRVALLRCRTDAASASFVAGVRASASAVDLEPHLAWLPQTIEARALGPITRIGDAPLRAETDIDVLVVASEPALRGFAERLHTRLSRRGARVRCIDDASLSTGLLGVEALSVPVLVGPAGFNLTYEAHALGTWHVALPRPRSYDDQRRRAQRVALVPHGPEGVERLVLQLLERGGRAPRIAPLVSADALAQAVLSLQHG